MNLCQSSVLAQSIQRWHEGVSLLTPLTLLDLMRHSLVVVPHIRGILAVKHPDERKERGQISIVVEGLQHGLPCDVVESPYPVDGQQSLRGIQFRHGPDHPSNAICPSSREQRVLEWHARVFELLGTLLSHGTCHSSAEGFASDNATDPAVLLELPNTQMFSCLCNQQRRCFVIQQHLQVFIGVACDPTCGTSGRCTEVARVLFPVQLKLVSGMASDNRDGRRSGLRSSFNVADVPGALACEHRTCLALDTSPWCS